MGKPGRMRRQGWHLVPSSVQKCKSAYGLCKGANVRCWRLAVGGWEHIGGEAVDTGGGWRERVGARRRRDRVEVGSALPFRPAANGGRDVIATLPKAEAQTQRGLHGETGKDAAGI